MNFQGRLAKPDGTPVPDNASQSVTFRAFSVATGGTALWSQTSTIAVHDGAFSAALNLAAGYLNGNTLASVFGNTLVTPYLELQVGGAPPLSPRQLIRSVAYSLYAATVPDGSVTGVKLAAGTITADRLAPSVLGGATSGYFLNVNAAPTGVNPRQIVISGSYLYLVNYSSNSLQIFDISAPAQPALVGSVATASGPIYLAVSGNYAYVVNNAGNTLQIFDVTSKTAPAPVGSVATSSSPYSVAISGNYAYVTTSGGNNLQIFNVATKTAPALAGAIGAGTNPEDVAVSGNYAYVLNYSNNSLQTFNVSNPAGPSLANTLITAGGAYHMALSGNYLYVANYLGSVFTIYSLANPAAPALVSMTPTSDAFPFAIAVSGNIVYLTSVGSSSLLAYDVSNPAAPVSLGKISMGNNGNAVAASGGNVFVSVTTQNVLRVFQTPAPILTAPNLAVTGILTAQNGIGAPNGFVSLYGSLVLDPFGKNGGALTPGIVFGGVNYGEGVSSNRIGAANQYGLDFYTNYLSRLAITNAGRVGIGNTNPAYPLDVTGDINARGVVRANGTALTSDLRYKTNIAPLNNALGDILNLRGVSYDWDREKWPAKNFSDAKQFGFIAQELEKIFPELVTTDTDGYKAVNYVGVVPVLVEAVKTQQKQIDAQKREIEELKARVKRQEDVEKRLNALENALNLHTMNVESKVDAKK